MKKILLVLVLGLIISVPLVYAQNDDTVKPPISIGGGSLISNIVKYFFGGQGSDYDQSLTDRVKVSGPAKLNPGAGVKATWRVTPIGFSADERASAMYGVRWSDRPAQSLNGPAGDWQINNDFTRSFDSQGNFSGEFYVKLKNGQIYRTTFPVTIGFFSQPTVPQIKITSPNSGEILVANQPYAVTWSFDRDVDASLYRVYLTIGRVTGDTLPPGYLISVGIPFDPGARMAKIVPSNYLANAEGSNFRVGACLADANRHCVSEDYSDRSFTLSRRTISDDDQSLRPKPIPVPSREVPPPPRGWACGFDRSFGVGEKGVDVTRLQELLGVDRSGYFDEDTAAGVVRLQAKLGVIQTGYFGPLTRAAIAKNYPCDNGRSDKPMPDDRSVAQPGNPVQISGPSRLGVGESGTWKVSVSGLGRVETATVGYADVWSDRAYAVDPCQYSLQRANSFSRSFDKAGIYVGKFCVGTTGEGKYISNSIKVLVGDDLG